MGFDLSDAVAFRRQLREGISVLFAENDNLLVFDAAAFADAPGRWAGNWVMAIPYRSIGVYGMIAALTRVLDMYRNKHDFSHAAPRALQ